jgi:YD repeat-containing protein
LGRGTAGKAPGAFRLTFTRPSPALGRPQGLRLDTFRSETEVVRKNGEIRQVRSPQAFADVVVLTPHSYAVRYYLPSAVGPSKVDGVYPVSGDPFVTWIFDQTYNGPEDPSELVVTEQRAAESRTWSYFYQPQAKAWKLTYPGPLRTEVGTWGLENGLWVRRIITGSPITEVLRTENRFAMQSFLGVTNQFLVSSTQGFGPDAHTTTYSYYPQGLINGTFLPLRHVFHPDGSWEGYTYDSAGRVSERRQPVGDSPTNAPDSLLRVTSYHYGPGPVAGSGDDGSVEPDVARRIDETVQGTLVSRRYAILLPGERRDITCTTPAAAWNDAANLVTVTRYFTQGGNKGRVASIRKPDGMMSLFDYIPSADAARQTNTVRTGQANAAGTDIVAGTATTLVQGKVGQLLSRTVQDIATATILERDLFENFDEFDRARLVTHLDGSQEQTHYTCCGIDYTVDRDQVTTQYQYDILRRPIATTRLNVSLQNTLDALGNVLETRRVAAGGSTVLQYRAGYDTAGNLVVETNALGGVTRITESRDAAGHRVRTTMAPLDGSRVETYAFDGQLLSLTGSAVFPSRFERGVESDPTSPGVNLQFTREIKLTSQGGDTPEWVKTYVDAAGRIVLTLYPDATAATLADNPVERTFYDAAGRVSRQTDPDGVTTLWSHDVLGRVVCTAIDINQNGVIDYAGPDRISCTAIDYTLTDGLAVQRRRTFAWDVPNQNVSNLVSTAEWSMDGRVGWSRQHDGPRTLTTRSERSISINGASVTTRVHPDGSTSSMQFQFGRLLSSTWTAADGTVIEHADYTYDAHGRASRATDARNGATLVSFNDADQITRLTTPAPAVGESPQVTLVDYDQLGRAWRIVQPGGGVITNLYLPTGLTQKTFGNGLYPAAYTYDAQGRMTGMTTWQNALSGAGAATTTWSYDLRRGWLTRKSHSGEGDATADYEYTAAGRLKRRLWERGVTTTYAYSAGGDLTTVDYSDATSDLVFTHDRRGRRQTVAQGSTTSALAYNNQDQLQSESWSGGGLSGIALSIQYDHLLRRTNTSLNTAVPIQTGFAYDGASRIQRVWQGDASADYSFVPNASLIRSVTVRRAGAVRATSIREHDFLNRLTSLRTTPSASGQPELSFAYELDGLNQRRRSTLSEGDWWEFDYDDLGQLTAGRRFWNDGTLVPGQQYHYSFDHIGNRLQVRSGGDANGGGLRSSTYTSNPLNQILNRTVPGGFDVLGLATPAASVTVNGSPADYRRADYFREAVVVSNATAAVWSGVSVVATNAGSSTRWTPGSVFVPTALEGFSYDADANLLADARWNYTWDAENRLVRMASRSPAGPQQRIEFGYDWMGRRISKRVWNNTAGSGTPSIDVLFVYDGWNLIAELSGVQQGLVRSYAWGPDLSGTLQGAGGVGGLLFVTPAGLDPQAAVFDGNGNVMALVNTGSGVISALFEYGPFGEPIRVSGPMAAANPFRFSSKSLEEESGLVYYGFRTVCPAIGRLLDRASGEESAR